MRHRTGSAATALACLLLAAGAGACGDEEKPSTDADPGTESPRAETDAPAPGPPSGEVTEPAEPGPADDAEERAAERAARSLVVAIDARDAAAACALLAPAALEGVKGTRGDCEPDLDRLIGRRPPGGAPAWDGTRIERLVSVVAEAGRARVTLEVFHRFSDRKNPSVEDDVIFLELSEGRWLVSQPDATLYRAVGYPEPPLKAYTPPAG